jgi:hypothetical protein
LNYSNFVESHLQQGGLYSEVKDAASKSAENVARMAALFHHFECRTGDIEYDLVDMAAYICSWYLNEFKRIFVPPPVIPEKELDAMALDSWLRNTHLESGGYLFEKKYIQMYGLNEFSNSNRLNSAINILTHAGCIRYVKHAKNREPYLELNLGSYPYRYV